MSPFKVAFHKKLKRQHMTAYLVTDRITGQLVGITEKYLAWSEKVPGEYVTRWRALDDKGNLLGENYLTHAESIEGVTGSVNLAA